MSKTSVLLKYMKSIKDWMALNFSQLNTNKTEMLFFAQLVLAKM